MQLRRVVKFFYKLLGVILLLFSQLSILFVLLSVQKEAKSSAQRFTIQTKLCVPVALFSPLLSLRGKFGNGATRCTRLPCNAALQRSNMLRSFSSFAANNNSRSYSAVFRRLLLQWKTNSKSNSSLKAKWLRYAAAESMSSTAPESRRHV